jgi:tubulin polyglutamylase TTLL2
MKWDLRIYVTIPKVRPLKIYLYSEGLVRFSTDRYDKS